MDSLPLTVHHCVAQSTANQHRDNASTPVAKHPSQFTPYEYSANSFSLPILTKFEINIRQ
jgi:hypothetical protein